MDTRRITSPLIKGARFRARVISVVRHFLFMFGEPSKSRLVFLAALIIGSIGACGQSFLIHHDLVDTYPYKIMSFPPPEFYANIANFGVYLAPAFAILSGILFGLKKFWLATIAPVVACPLLFAVVFKTASLEREWKGIIDVGRNFDETKSAAVAQSFYLSMTSYVIVGLVVGAIGCFLLSRLAKDRKLA